MPYKNIGVRGTLPGYFASFKVTALQFHGAAIGACNPGLSDRSEYCIFWTVQHFFVNSVGWC